MAGIKVPGTCPVSHFVAVAQPWFAAGFVGQRQEGEARAHRGMKAQL